MRDCSSDIFYWVCGIAAPFVTFLVFGDHLDTCEFDFFGLMIGYLDSPMLFNDPSSSCLHLADNMLWKAVNFIHEASAFIRS